MTKDYFYCYDIELFDYLDKAGFKFIVKARHYKDYKLFSLFERSDEFNEVLDQWNNIKVK